MAILDCLEVAAAGEMDGANLGGAPDPDPSYHHPHPHPILAHPPHRPVLVMTFRLPPRTVTRRLRKCLRPCTPRCINSISGRVTRSLVTASGNPDHQMWMKWLTPAWSPNPKLESSVRLMSRCA